MLRFTLFLILAVFITELSFSKPNLHSGSPSRFQSATDVNPKIQQINPDDMWSDVKVDFNWLLKSINSDTCSSDQKTYIACVLAVQEFGTGLNKNLEVIPVTQLNGAKPFYKAERLALVEVPPLQINSAKEAFGYFEKVRTQMSSRFFSMSANFVKLPNMDFELMLHEIYQRSGKTVKPSVIVSTVGKLFEVAIDPHTSIRPTKELEKQFQQGGESFVGIGIEFVRLAGQGLMVKRVIKGGGAARAGLQIGDVILSVEGRALKDLKDEEAVNLMRGIANTTVNLAVQRAENVFSIDIVRAQIVSPVISSESMKFNGKTYAYVRLSNFMFEGICKELASVVQSWEKLNVDGYVLDLRNNPGGNVKIAACVGGLFLGGNKVLTYFEKRGAAGSTYSPLNTTDMGVTSRKPMSVLVNAFSASASEIIAGTFKDYGRAYIVGVRTFGKGSYQGCGQVPTQRELTMCSTNGLFYAPSGNTNQTVGIVPHVEVYQDKEPKEADKFAMREAQMYLFPLENIKMPNAPIGNWNPLKAPTLCMEKLNLVDSYDRATSAVAYFKDFQLLNGLAAVNCAP